jgi:hypothetical protein
MEINWENYEAYLLDQLEGKLSLELQLQLRDFLAMNPDCATESGEEFLWTLPRDHIEFPHKHTLKKEIPDGDARPAAHNFDLFCIARMEGDLSAKQVREHDLMIEEDPDLQTTWRSWQKTRLRGDTVRFPGKNKLKRKVPGYRSIQWITLISSAAAIALIAVILTHRHPPAFRFAADEEIRLPLNEGKETFVPVPTPLKNLPFRLSSHDGKALPPTASSSKHVQESIEDVQGPDRASGMTDKQGALLPDPLRVVLAVNSIPAPVARGEYDRIRPLKVPDSPVHMNRITLSRLADMNLQEVVEEYAKEKDFSIWTIASAGIKGINLITGSNMELFAARDNEGDVTGFQFKSKRLNITTPLAKQE